MEHALALDIGGTKLAAALVDERGTVSRRTVVPTARTDDAEMLFDQVCALLDQLGPFDQYTVCGVGCPGPMEMPEPHGTKASSVGPEPHGTKASSVGARANGTVVSPLNIPAWDRFPLAERLAEYTGLPTHLDNDAKALALAEGWLGAAAGVRDFVAMVVSTGVGGGIVLDGRLLNGRLGNAGHVGQIVVNPGGMALPGQIPGSLECEASGTAIEVRTGQPSAEACTSEIRHVGTMVGRAVGSLANALDLHLAVVGGSVALGFGEPFFAAAQTEIDRVATLSYSRGTRIEPVGLGIVAPLVGAAAVGFRGARSSVAFG